MKPPRLVFAIGNASRGDDALGPALAAALRAEGWFDGANAARAELVETYQLQIEDALELQGREAVLFVDASRTKPDGLAPVGVTLRALRPGAVEATPFTHALEPAALLDVYRRVCGEPPPASVLAIAGSTFELGAPLTAAARSRLPAALAVARRWLGGDPRAASPGAASIPIA